MADFNDVASAITGASSMINSQLTENGITNLASTARGLIVDLLTISIDDMCNFNARNYAYMTYHMLRNIHEKNITLSTVGENAYPQGNPELASMSPQKPSYTDGNNYYVDFMENVRDMASEGQLTTRVTTSMDNPGDRSNLFNTVNMYFDAKDGATFDQDGHATLGPVTNNKGIEYTGKAGDVNSILYKMEKLSRANKVNTIISKFHTSNDIKYAGEVGSQFGESHGRNLLKKGAEDGSASSEEYLINGYDNPYCRVWTHHYMYDRLSKTMRANMGGINYWGQEFEWNQNDKGHDAQTLEQLYGKEPLGENYDYAWRGQANQKRRSENSVLDLNGSNTGLPIMTPKFNGGGDSNVHTKSCMFSIENLAWKDYDPYAFEQALSWEQRGPFGGRIMWFPPYNLKINETSSAKWNSNDFIGRGESVYTYVNSERTGTLSFTLLTDHPSSVDYATWWTGQSGDLGEGIEKQQWGVGDKETDFLRYFAGCMGDKNGGTDNSLSGADNIQEKPTPMTDEYEMEPLVGTNGEKVQSEEVNNYREAIVPPEVESTPEKHPFDVEFFVFYPNNYSGILDRPGNKDNGKYYHNGQTPKVDAMFYLLAGRGAGKTDKYNDKELSMDMANPNNWFDTLAIGYEMGTKALSQPDENNTYIQGGVYKAVPWTAKSNKLWGYRIDHIQDDDGHGYTKYRTNTKKNSKGTKYVDETLDSINTLDQDVSGYNLLDYASPYQFNLRLDDYLINTIGISSDNLYSFAEVAMAMYSENVLNYPVMYNYLNDKLSSISGAIDRVNKLIEIFTSSDYTLESIDCKGTSNQHGSDSGRNTKTDRGTRRNNALAENRRDTVVSWIRSVGKWSDVNNVSDADSWDSDKIITDKGNKTDAGYSAVSTPVAKLYRNAYCHMKFNTTSTQTTSQSNIDPSKVKTDYYQMIPFWKNNESYTANTVVQKDQKAYKAVTDIECVDSGTTGECSGPELTDTAKWAEVTVKEYDESSSYTTGEYILYKNYVYEVLQDIEGAINEHKDAEFLGYKGFKHVKDEDKGNGVTWHYYKKDAKSTYWEQKASGETSSEDEHELKVGISQVLDVFTKVPYCGTKTTDIESNENYRGEYDTTGTYSLKESTSAFDRIQYSVTDIVKYNNKYYRPKYDFKCNKNYDYFTIDETGWSSISDSELSDYFKSGYTVISEVYRIEAEKNNMCYFKTESVTGGIWKLCERLLTDKEGREKTDTPTLLSEHWKSIDNFSTNKSYVKDDYVVYNASVYKCKVESVGSGKFNPDIWEKQSTKYYSPFDYYVEGEIVKDNTYFICLKTIKGVEQQVWTSDIQPAIKNLIKNECKDDYSFNGTYPYKEKDVIYHNNLYMTTNVDISSYKYPDNMDRHEFDSDDWEELSESELTTITYTTDDFTLQQLASNITCYDEDEFRKLITNNGNYEPFPPEYHTTYLSNPNIFGYGTISDEFWTGITTSTDLADYVSNAIGHTITFTSDETNMLSLLISEDNLEHDLSDTCRYIGMYRLISGITKLVSLSGSETDPCDKEGTDDEELVEKSIASEGGSDCDESLWVDRGDGVLIQLCSLVSDGTKSRFDTSTGKGDWNKLRYDQEYYFYRRYFADHPFVFDKLQDKLKYFQPAFHSMTPEGFNARLTFLQQCTRQGNTKTMSDVGGKTANNLAFGRAPYCVLRLGDFYYQMIVIDSISFDYSVSDGLQWDLNPEGNGVQPMLCNVNISFKFIGGGDITGPVRRLQNAMSFNYYANTSFYDNRADRVEYQHNSKTMGGAGNNKVIEENSYAFQAKMYEGDERDVVMDNNIK